jgi:formate-dependent nitrite reductase cytochrome c552 subunit
VNLSTRTGWDADAEKRKAQRGAFWNWGLVSNDKSLGVHNPQYAIALLQKSWSKASQALGGPSFAETFPQADLR